jgi:hypothetical protein
MFRRRRRVDGRHKPGHDDAGRTFLETNSYRYKSRKIVCENQKLW